MSNWLRIGSDRINLDHVAIIQHFEAIAEESQRCRDQSGLIAVPRRMILFKSVNLLQADYYVCEGTLAYMHVLTFLQLTGQSETGLK